MEHTSHAWNFPTRGKLSIFKILVFFALLLSFSPDLWAKPMDAGEAKKAVKGWLKFETNPLGTLLGQQVRKVDTFSDANGEPIYHIVYLQPAGFVIVPAENLIEPIIGFVEYGTYDPSEDNPLVALVSRDLPTRVAAARKLQPPGRNAQKKGLTNGNGKMALQKAALKARGKWNKLQDYADMVGVMGVSGISEVRVAPLVQSTWGQMTVGGYFGGISCYNFFTPPYAPGDPNNYPCGCVATAMAQLMRYHEYPVNPYVWSNMPLRPDDNILPIEQQAIGDLCYDAASAVDTIFGPGGSYAYLFDADEELKDTFGYSNSIHGCKNGDDIGAGLTGMINPNLDSNHPVILGIRGISPGHAIICDGYGYDGSTLYHHLNMGWDGLDNVWYVLPIIEIVEAGISYDTVDTCVYNIFTSGSGEIISGRITEPDGVSISGATVTATGGGTHYATSNDNGIYALAKVPSGTTFTISVDKGDWSFSSRIEITGTSTGGLLDYSISGNVWGADFSGTISAGYIELNKETYVVPEAVGIRVVDSDLVGNGSQQVELKICGGDTETVTLSETPPGSGVFTGSIPAIEAATVTEDGTIQVTQSKTIVASYEDGDNGTGNTAVATDTAAVGLNSIIYETDFTGGLPDGWAIIDGGSSTHTWTATSGYEDRFNENWTGTFMIVDSNQAGNVDMDEQLLTHSIDCSSYVNVTLKFKHYFNYWESGLNEICDVDVRIGGGLWKNVTSFQGADTSGQVELSLSEFSADAQVNVQVRWHYYNAHFENYWGIDDVEIAGVTQPEQAQFLGDFEPDCDVDIDDLAVFAQQWLLRKLSVDFAPDAGDYFVNFLDWAVFAKAWQSIPSSPNWNPACDIFPGGGDGIVDLKDLAVFIDQWQQLGADCADIAPVPDGDGMVNMLDFAIFADNWLAGS
ncbi:MAG: C10 family peptidase [Planctomycetota bacterium]